MEKNSSQRVLEFIQSQVDLPITRETTLDSLGFDSLELLELQLECGNHFGKHVPDKVQNSLYTVGDLVDFFS